MGKQIAALGLALALPLAPLSAQGLNYTLNLDEPEEEVERVTAEEALQNSQNMYGPPPPRRDCRVDSETGEIVVCAEEEQDDAQFRVQPTSELDPDSREALNDGLPRGADVPGIAGAGIFQGEGISLGSAPEPALMIDVEALPEAPEGSDADLIAKGKKKAN